MRIAVLGPLEVLTDDGAPLIVPGAKERLLLAALAAGTPGVVSTDSLAETLWNGDPPISARKSLQAHVVRLRSALEPGRPKGSTGRYVVRRGAGYALSVDRGSVDRLRIGDVAARGHARLASGEPEEAERELSAALDLWRGEPYADWPDAPFAEAERRRLAEVRAGAVAGLLEARLRLGRHADVLPELERLVAEEPLREDWWRLLMLALYRAGRQADALATARRARKLLAEELGVGPGPALRGMEAAILAQDPALDPPVGRVPPAAVGRARVADPLAQGSCPYKGLAAYQVADAALFHGRKRLVAGLVARLVDAPVLLVSGPSGAGKSSAVRAGLVPALTDGALPGSQGWRSVIVTPGTSPVDVLADLTGDRPPDEPVLLVCDQFEELWAPGVDPAERGAFLDAVLGLIDDGIVIRCVVVVRGDHVGRLAEHTPFAERVGSTFALVPPLTEPELREIVREPARAVGLRVDPELVDAVVVDVLGQAGALPLLSTALVGTWERRRGDQLTLAGYLEAGGVEGALTRSAEAAYGSLDDEGQDVARRFFVRLADTDDGGALVRRPVPLAEMDLSGARREVVESFVDRRLVALDGDRLEVAHEALLTAWPRLVRWLEDDAVGRAVRRHLAPAAREWEAGGRPDDELYRGARLAAALDWTSGADADVTPVEQRFLDASRNRADAELHEARDRADREAAARHRARRLAVGLAAVLVLALVATVLAVRSSRQAQEASVVADANRLAAQSRTAGSLDVALLLAAQAVRLADTPETQDGLLAALTESGRAERAVPFPGTPFNAHLSGGGRTLTFGTGSEVVVWAVGPTTRARVGYRIPAHWGSWITAAGSPTEDVVMGAGINGGVPWLRMIAPDGTDRFLQQGDEVGGRPVSGTVSPDGRRVHLLVATPEGDAPDSPTRWRITDVDAMDGSTRETGLEGTSTAPVEELAADFGADAGSAVLWGRSGTAAPTLIDLSDGHRSSVTTERSLTELLDLHALDDGAALLWNDGEVTLVDGDGRTVQQLDAHQEPVRDLVVSPDGTWAVTVGDGPSVILWDIARATGRWSQREVLTGHVGDVLEAVVDPSGGRLITASADHTIISWDVTTDGGLGESYPGLTGRWFSSRPRVIEPGELLVAPTRPGNPTSEDRESSGPGPETLDVAATFFDPATGEVVAEIEVGETVPDALFGSSVSVSPDESMVAVTWGLGTTVLDTRTREVIQEIVLPADGADLDGRPLPGGPVWSAGWTPDGSTLLLGAEGLLEADGDGYLAAADTTTWELGERIEIGAAQTIEVSPDERLLAVALEDVPSIVLLDAATLDVERSITLSDDRQATTLAFSPDGRWLAAGGLSGLLHVLDTETWEPVREATAVLNTDLLQIEWLDDDPTVVASGLSGAVVLFDVDRGLVRARPLRGSREPGEGYAHLVPTPTDELVVLSGERTGWRYPLDVSAWLEEACSIVGRDMTRAEWDLYLPGREPAPTCSDLP